MDPYSRFLVYLLVLVFALLGGVYKIKYRDNATKVLVALLCITLISELTAYWAAVKYRNNMFVYHFFSPVQLIMLGIYFDSIESRFKKYKVGLTIGIFGVAITIVNTLFFQSLNLLNSNFLLFEGLAIMGLALYAFQRILTDDRINIFKHGHFWMVVVFIFFWSVTYTTWALYTVLQVKKLFIIPLVSHVLWAVNIITYSAIGFVLLYFSGKRLANE